MRASHSASALLGNNNEAMRCKGAVESTAVSGRPNGLSTPTQSPNCSLGSMNSDVLVSLIGSQRGRLIELFLGFAEAATEAFRASESRSKQGRLE
jgi:hypothetical protein